MGIKAFIAGCTGLTLDARERAFFRSENPWGFIVFARNIADAAQLSALCNELRESTGRDDTPILIDQEGGRVQRLRPPLWHGFPPGRVLGDIYRIDTEKGLRAAWLQSRLIASELTSVGVNVDCLPILDVPVVGAHDIIGDRAYSHQPYEVAQIGRAAADGLMAGGVAPIIKHIPGHGRASSDSHLELPRVDTHPAELGCTDFYPFMQLADLPMAMTAHVVYSGFDAALPATTSPTVISEIIRGWLGFDGLLMSDDLSMKALAGGFADRTTASFDAGCDVVLHCNGDMAEMAPVADNSPVLAGKPLWRAEKAMERVTLSDGADAAQIAAWRLEFDALLALTKVS